MMYSRGPTFKLILHPDFKADLDELWDKDEETAADIVAFIESVEDNQVILDELSCNGRISYRDVPFDVKSWAQLQKNSVNMWRVRLLETTATGKTLRLIYAYEPQEHCYHFLAIAPRNFNYELSHAISKRALTAYKRLFE